jgi:hypothetical protein
MAVAGNAEWRCRAELTSLLQACRSRMARPVPPGANSGLRQEDAGGRPGGRGVPLMHAATRLWVGRTVAPDSWPLERNISGGPRGRNH